MRECRTAPTSLEQRARRAARGRALRAARGASPRSALITDVGPRGGREGPRRAGGREQARELDWFTRADDGARRLEPAVLQVVRGRHAQRLATTAWTATSRRASATASPSTGAARRARSATSPTPSCSRRPALRQRAEGPRRRQGRRRRDLPADDPRGRRRDARLRAHRRAAQRRLRRLLAPSRSRERMEFSDAKALITVDGARRKGKTAPVKAAVDEVMGDLARSRRSSSCATPAIDCADGPSSDVWFDEALEAADAECPAEPLDAEHPLFILYSSRLDGQAEGHPAHDRRLPDRRRLDAQARLRPQARATTCTGARPTSAGSPGTPTSSTGRCSTARRR